ncbi:gas vesicle protein GvpJ [Micromonospora noduli]|uniref:Gas vesicle protein A n=1 Tax=Micromonospora noduli TaxID=709876 RepID=A0A328NEL6_9ACTN|nr:gas vesicle protein GvpJ [Micromonospora noduli]KAB1924662.1 gas vesicle protein [Micromonospora noduli]RAO04591.1 Gas vesicle structural protein [Micromonospora noduli]RAO07639.1 Gas vesicle structural protein [Micromonospora noduli]RAO10248.1 Gas vesicle structural protein [Micromonospora noduli]RAO25543.1 Gas vesicle structural protein [Micromonospora noduli]
MTLAAGDAAAGGALERVGSAGGLADVVETVLDKGVVIDAQVTVGVVGIPLVEINARVVVASIETYLRFAEAVDRLDLAPAEGEGLAGLVGGVTGAVRDVTGSVRDVTGAVGDATGNVRDLGRS